MKKTEEVYYTTKIWKHFESISSHENIERVKDLVEYANPILDRIVETFPTYTLHNGQHQLNILNLFEKILGDRIVNLSSLESALLILSSFFHDIGMVFKESERNDLAEEKYFKEFLNKNPRANLIYTKENKISNKIAEWYCRWIHAKRVWKYLDNINDKLMFDGVNIRKELAELCLSHNEKTEDLKNDNLKSAFWNNSDLKFCAIILRTADILDFDKTRSPISVYQFLNLDNPIDDKELMSHNEWKKHLASKGFDFSNWTQENNYTLGFKASPTKPIVEHDINNFLDLIEHELAGCSIIFRYCSDRWQNFKLPEKINRSNIISQGYSYGDIKFNIDQKQILSIFMGENLYTNKFIFLRELLQNSIDTSRHREAFEKSDFHIKPIQISSWIDSDGYKWVRFDDFGMGMTLTQINKYFLSIGNSYYNSDDFLVEKLQYANSKRDFTPISRFGIGILSCFIAADKIEVSTHSKFSEKDSNVKPIRLSLKGINSFYVLQTDRDIPNEMPSEHGFESGYRVDFGTTIAVRIKPKNDDEGKNLLNILNQFLLNPDIPIVIEGKKNVGILKQDKNFNSGSVVKYQLEEKEIDKIKDYFNEYPLISIKPEISIAHIDLSKAYSNPKIKGYIYLINAKLNANFEKNDEDENDIYELSLSYYNFLFSKRPQLELSIKLNQDSIYYEDDQIQYEDIKDIKINISRFIKDMQIFNGDSNFNEKIFSKFLLAHNGIVFNNKQKIYSFDRDDDSRDCVININVQNIEYEDSIALGIINLSDDLRPNLSVARNRFISSPWVLWSNLNYCIRKNLSEIQSVRPKIDLIESFYFKLKFSFDELNNDELINNKDYWPSEKIFSSGEYSIDDLVKSNKEIKIGYTRLERYPSELLERKIIERHSILKIKVYKKEFEEDGQKKYIAVTRGVISEIQSNNNTYTQIPPLTFCEYVNFDGLMPNRLSNKIYNVNHPFSQWLLKSYNVLNNNYSSQLFHILNASDISIVNNILNKLRLLLPTDIKPPKDLKLSDKDFKVNLKIIPEIDKKSETITLGRTYF